MTDVIKTVLLDMAVMLIVFCLVYIAYEIVSIRKYKKLERRANKIREGLENGKE